jgi:hypothetical protein
MRVYRDIPMPSWQVVFPDKLLQFRPLDLLRTDLFALVGVVSAVANSKYSSAVLQAVTLVTVGIALSRLVLGFLRMSDRYRGIVSDLLRERTIASQEGAIEYLSASASLQQFKQCALAYTLLAIADEPLTGEQLAIQAEQLLKQRLNLVVRFDAAEALSELQRFGVLIEHGAHDADGAGSGGAVSDAAWSSASTNGSASSSGSAKEAAEQRRRLGHIHTEVLQLLCVLAQALGNHLRAQQPQPMQLHHQLAHHTGVPLLERIHDLAQPGAHQHMQVGRVA